MQARLTWNIRKTHVGNVEKQNAYVSFRKVYGFPCDHASKVQCGCLNWFGMIFRTCQTFELKIKVQNKSRCMYSDWM